MTTEQIEKRQELDVIRYEAAKTLRKALDAAQKAYVKAGGDPEAWNEEEDVIQSLVFEEES